MTIPFLKQRPLSSVLALNLDGSRLEGVVVRRADGSLQALQSFSVSLTLDPLTAEPELVGREIRNHLDGAGIRERSCVFGLPLKWALTTQIEVPEMPEEDIPGFLAIEAERGFHSDVTTLHFAASRCQLRSGKQIALLAGIPRKHLTLIEEALRAAGLKPVGLSLGITALQPPVADVSHGIMALAIGEASVGLAVTCGGGVAALRSLAAGIENEGSQRVLHPDLVAREARITLGQLPAELRDSVRTIRIFGPRDLAQQLADEIELRLGSMGLQAQIVSQYSPGEFGLQLSADAAVSPALSIAANALAGRKRPFELLPPRVSQWQQLATRYSSGKLRTAGATAAAIAALVLAAFVFQQVQLVHLRSQWAGMSAKVKQLEGVEGEIRQYRSWYDQSYRDLSILKKLTAAFPETGVVSAKTIEIRDLNNVTCTGTTSDQGELLKVFGNLRADNNISDLKVGPIRGAKMPKQFSFDFRWNEGGK